MSALKSPLAFIARPNDLLEISILRVQRMLESHLSDSRLVHGASQLIFWHSNQARGFRTLFSNRPQPSS
jgi:hypothetical protein